MNERIKKGWEWIKDHKKEIAIVGVTSIVSAIGGVILYKNFSHTNVMKNWNPPKLNISDNSIDGNLVRCHDGAVELFIYEEIPLDAMGEFGKYIMANIPDLPNNPETVYLEMAIPN